MQYYLFTDGQMLNYGPYDNEEDAFEKAYELEVRGVRHIEVSVEYE